MKNVENRSSQGFAGKLIQGWAGKASVIALGAALLLLPMASSAAMMGNHIITQLDLINSLATLVGDPTPASADAAVYYAKKHLGLKPKAGWNPSANLTREFLAEIIQDMFRLKGKDAVMALEREGIYVPANPEITWTDLSDTVSDPEFLTPLGHYAGTDCSPSKKTHKHKLSKKHKSKCSVKSPKKPKTPKKPKH